MTCNLDGNELLTTDNFGLELLERPSDEEAERKSTAEDEPADKEMTDLQRPSVELPQLDHAVVVETRVKSPVRKRERQDTEIWEEDSPTERECKMADVIQTTEEVITVAEGEEVGGAEGEEGVASKPEDDIAIEDVTQEDAEEPGLERELKMSDVGLQSEELAEGAEDGASDQADVEETAAQEQELGSPEIEEGVAIQNEEVEALNEEERDRIGSPQSREELEQSDSECEKWDGEEMALGRKHVRRRDGNPKPTKRRRAVLESSPVSEKYHRESLCGVDDRLHDGFYDPGRERPFRSLEEFEREVPCLHSREVILVDRCVHKQKFYWWPLLSVRIITAAKARVAYTSKFQSRPFSPLRLPFPRDVGLRLLRLPHVPCSCSTEKNLVERLPLSSDCLGDDFRFCLHRLCFQSCNHADLAGRCRPHLI